MKIVDLNKSKGVRFILFPDNQPHVIVDLVTKSDEVTVICSITNSLKMMHLLQTANAIDHLNARKKLLVIPYLMGARYDRVMANGDSCDIEVIASLINACQFEQVILFDVHSELSLRLIRNSTHINNRQLVELYDREDAVVICPDTGASKKVQDYLKWNKHLSTIVYCTKTRDLATGKIILEVREPEKCKDRNCVIIDDICDGGATFLAIAGQIRPMHLTLIVTHGIFSKGFSLLEQTFDEIIVSDSYRRNYDSPIVKTIPLDITGEKKL